MMRVLGLFLVLSVGFFGGLGRAETADATDSLGQAVMTNNEAAIQALVKGGADVNAPRAWGGSVLHSAATATQVKPDTVRLLLQLGGNPELPDRGGFIPLSYAVKDLEKVKILGPATKSPGLRWQVLYSYLDGIENSESETVVSHLLEVLKLDVNGADDSGLSPLMAAARGFFPRVVRLLIGRGANVNARDTQGRTALLHALEHYKIIINTPDDKKSARDISLHCRETFELLLASKADASVVDVQGRTAIITYLNGNLVKNEPEKALAIVRTLKKAGASVSARDKSKKTARDYLPALKSQLPQQTFASLRQLLRPS